MRQAVGFRDRTTVDAQKMVAQLDLAQHAVLIKVLTHKHRSDIHRHAKSNVLSLSFEIRGWDKKTGVPTRDKLVELGLNDVAEAVPDA